MLLDGIWVFEVAGIYGWERISTAFMEKGRYLSGNASMFSQGTYVSNGNKVKIKLQVTQHAKKRAIFGEKRKQFSVVMTAKHDGKKIQGRVSLKGAKSTATEYPFRLLRQTDIPALPE
jgi:hypothetical protein